MDKNVFEEGKILMDEINFRKELLKIFDGTKVQIENLFVYEDLKEAIKELIQDTIDELETEFEML